MAFNKYGLRKQVSQPGRYGNFEFKILEKRAENNLMSREAHWINKLNPEYNVQRVGTNYTYMPSKTKTEKQIFIQYHIYKTDERYIPAFPIKEAEVIISNGYCHMKTILQKPQNVQALFMAADNMTLQY